MKHANFLKIVKALAIGCLTLVYLSASAQNFSPSKKRLDGDLRGESGRFSELLTESIGPTVMGGRVTDTEVNPNNPLEMVVAFASGGVWYTQNNGQSFRAIFDHQHSITVGDIAVNWTNFTIWVGTGECNSSRSSYAGTGIYKSSDTGKTWKHTGLEESHHIAKLLINPGNPQIIYAAVLGHLYTSNEERGVFKTSDGGESWQRVLFVNKDCGAIDLTFDPSNSETVVAAFWERSRQPWNFKGSGPGSGIYLSENAGTSWKKIYSGSNLGRIGLATYTYRGETGIYAIIDDQNPAKPEAEDTAKLSIQDLIKIENKPVEHFLAISDEKLKAFLKEHGFPEKYDVKTLKKLINSGKNTVSDVIKYTGNANQKLFNTNYKGSVIVKTESLNNVNWKVVNDSIKDLYYTYGYYFGQIRVNPGNPDELYILGVVLAHSTDGGKHFKKLNDDNVHADHHVLWINPGNPRHLINGNDGGLNISYDKGENWVKCNSPAVGQFYAVAVDEAQPYNVYGGLQDNGVWKGPRRYNPGVSWHQTGKYPYQFIMGGDGMQVAVDTRQNLVYTGYQFGNYYRLDMKTEKPVYITPTHELGELPYRFNWQTPVLLSRHTQNTIYLGGNYLFRSFDKGNSWKKISPDLSSGYKEGNVPYGTLSSIDESAIRYGLLYGGTDDGNIHVSKDAGNTWQKINIPGYNGFWIARILASSHIESRVYAALNGYRFDNFKAMVFVSEDFGKSWKSVAGNLPDEPVNVIREDLVNPNILYCGTDNGLYISMNRGLAWEKMGTLPRVAVHDLAIQSAANELLVGTHGRSLYVIGLKEVNALDSSVLKQNLLLFDVPKYKVNKSWGESDYFWNPPVQTRVSFPYYALITCNPELTFSDSTGKIIYREKLKSRPGINYAPFAFMANENKADSGFLKLGKDGHYYLKPGKYKVSIYADGFKDEKEMLLEKPGQ